MTKIILKMIFFFKYDIYNEINFKTKMKINLKCKNQKYIST